MAYIVWATKVEDGVEKFWCFRCWGWNAADEEGTCEECGDLIMTVTGEDLEA